MRHSILRFVCVYKYGPKAIFVQQSDDCHFNGKGFCGKQAVRERPKPPEYLLPVFQAGLRYIINTIQAQHEVTEGDIKKVLSW